AAIPPLYAPISSPPDVLSSILLGKSCPLAKLRSSFFKSQPLPKMGVLTRANADGAFELHAQARTFSVFSSQDHGQKDTLIFTDRPETISLTAQLTVPEYSAELANLR